MVTRITKCKGLCLLVAALAACDGPWCGDRFESKFELPREIDEIKLVCDRFATAIAAREYEKAYAMLCDGTRSTLSRDRFDRAMTENAYLRTAKAGNAERTSFGHGVGEMHGVIATDSGIVKADFFLSMPQGSGATMCITGLHVGGVPALPGPAQP